MSESFVLQIVVLAKVPVSPTICTTSRVGKILPLSCIVSDNLLQWILLRKTFDIFIEVQTVIKHILKACGAAVLVVQLHCGVWNEGLVLCSFVGSHFILDLVIM